MEENEVWRRLLKGESASAQRFRARWRMLPSAPRCAQCLSPFGGVGGFVMRALGRGPWPNNPRYCTPCFRTMEDNPGGAEVETTFVFADVRGSTALAEQLGAAAFSKRMNRFFDVATKIVIDSDGVVEKLIGDEVAAMYIPGFAGRSHAARGIEAARSVMAATWNAGTQWIPIGIGVHTGIAFVGNVGGRAGVTQFSALGDAVNIAARLASSAAAGEILVSAATSDAAGFGTERLEHRALELRGISRPVSVHVLRTLPR